jgi:hypothetical protein
MTRVLFACAVLLFASPVVAKGAAVSGTITLDGKPLAGGTITFISKDGKVKVAAPIAADGTYAATLGPGEYRVAVSMEAPKKGDPKEPPKKLPPVPAKYSDPKTTTLTVEVAKEKSNIDFVLTSK